MEGLVAMIILGDSKAFISRRSRPHQINLLVHSHPSEKILDPLRDRESLILIREFLTIGDHPERKDGCKRCDY